MQYFICSLLEIGWKNILKEDKQIGWKLNQGQNQNPCLDYEHDLIWTNEIELCRVQYLHNL